jgi:hypothetical protein
MTAKKIPKKSAIVVSVAAKHTLYIDAEDEITGIIDKVVSSKSSIIAVVLPKHASVFQSIVNMKLLKKAATQSKKNIVLITSDPSVMPIASTVGLLVSKTPSSKPAIPVSPTSIKGESTSVDGSKVEVGLASTPERDVPIELDNTTPSPLDMKPGGSKKKKEKNFRIPDFSSFRMKLLFGSGLVVSLIIMWVFGFIVLPRATISITSDTQSAPVNTLVTLSTGIEQADLESGVLPAKRAQIEKTEEATVPATGEKNIGQKATGSMNLSNCIKSDDQQVVPAGTRFSVGSITFESTEQAILPAASFYSSGTCKSKDNGDDKTVGVIAIEPGNSSNVGSQSYNSSISGIQAAGGAMSGGTTEIVTVISQDDIDRAKQQSSGTSKSAAVEELKVQLSKKEVSAIDESLTETEPKIDISPAIGTESSEVTVKTTASFAMLGVSDDDISAFLDKKIQDSLADQGKNIRDNGLATVSYSFSEQLDESKQILTLKTIGSVGPEFDIELLKESVAGKKRGDIEKQIEAIDGVKSVSVEYSPAWITTTPKSADKIDIVLNEQNDQ